MPGCYGSRAVLQDPRNREGGREKSDVVSAFVLHARTVGFFSRGLSVNASCVGMASSYLRLRPYTSCLCWLRRESVFLRLMCVLFPPTFSSLAPFPPTCT